MGTALPATEAKRTEQEPGLELLVYNHKNKRERIGGKQIHFALSHATIDGRARHSTFLVGCYILYEPNKS